MSLFATFAEIEAQRVAAAMCTVVSASGSTPRKPGTKMIVIDDHTHYGSIKGTIGGGAVEHHVRACAIDAIRQKRAALITTSLRNELGMCCGGEMTVFIEPLVANPPLLCFGAGHIAQALCPLAASLGFDVIVVDDRQELLRLPAFTKAKCRQNDSSIFSIKDMPFGEDTFVVVATHDHELDQRVVESILPERYHYAALVGSKRKAEMTRKRLRAKGFAESTIAQIRCPAGLSINATTPEEIALSIAAEMIQVKNHGAQFRSTHRGRGLKLAHGQP